MRGACRAPAGGSATTRGGRAHGVEVVVTDREGNRATLGPLPLPIVGSRAALQILHTRRFLVRTLHISRTFAPGLCRRRRYHRGDFLPNLPPPRSLPYRSTSTPSSPSPRPLQPQQPPDSLSTQRTKSNQTGRTFDGLLIRTHP